MMDNQKSKYFKTSKFDENKIIQNLLNFYPSDNIRQEYIKAELLNPSHFDDPDYGKLVDDWDGYDDQVYVQTDRNNIKFYEGWVQSCWDAIKLKQQYDGMEKEDIIDDIIKNRFSIIAKNLNLKIIDKKIFKFRRKYIMKVVFSNQ